MRPGLSKSRIIIVGFRTPTVVIPVNDTQPYQLFAYAALVPMVDAVAKCVVSKPCIGPRAMSTQITLESSDFPSNGNWTNEQTKLAFELYCRTPFGKLHHGNSQIVELAELIGRTPSALAMKLSNFASLDPSITSTGRVGLRSASARDREIWDAFHADWEGLAVECAELLQSLRHSRQQAIRSERAVDSAFDLDDYSGETRRAIVQQRAKQEFFRRAVLTSYGGRCCISGVSDARFLIASHIVPWREDKANRLNPRNGLCLSAIHDKAFDRHLFTLGVDGQVVLSPTLKQTQDTFLREVFWPTEGSPIEAPERFAPDPELMAQHRERTLSATEVQA